LAWDSGGCQTNQIIDDIYIESNGREEDALDKLDHPNVVKLFHVESDSVFK
jgi:hypothetical protein